MDVLLEVLKVVRLEGAFFFNAEIRSCQTRRLIAHAPRRTLSLFSGRLSDGIPGEMAAQIGSRDASIQGRQHCASRRGCRLSAAIAKRGLPVSRDRRAGAVDDHTCPR